MSTTTEERMKDHYREESAISESTLICISILGHTYYKMMMEQKDELAKLSKYKQFLIENGFPENLPDYDI